MDNISRIIINKNRGWRGLAEVRCEDSERRDIMKMIFSFSEPVWRDMLEGFIVLQDEDNYIILEFNNRDELPRPTQQRSVLIKYFIGEVVNTITYSKDEWEHEAPYEHRRLIDHFIKNRNNHTTSDWNCIGIRVIPMI